MKKVGLIGWRGMVGSVLLQRMLEESDFRGIAPHFYSTSSAGSAGPVIDGITYQLKDANSVNALAEMDIIITCQGGDYTKAIYPALSVALCAWVSAVIRKCHLMMNQSILSSPSVINCCGVQPNRCAVC
ncbi:hypothetical protein [Photorhabdus sp. RM322S]|uniref:hypothetical protein n=1 Tax=Photorhabdus TaxID=29487 RepID=UPI0036D8386D